MSYPKAYHVACTHLVSFGAHGGDTTRGRRLVAVALRALRDRDRITARRERRHMLFISGMFPVKEIR